MVKPQAFVTNFYVAWLNLPPPSLFLRLRLEVSLWLDFPNLHSVLSSSTVCPESHYVVIYNLKMDKD